MAPPRGYVSSLRLKPLRVSRTRTKRNKNGDTPNMTIHNDGLDDELYEREIDAERAAQLDAMADHALADLDAERHLEADQIEAHIRRQLADLDIALSRRTRG